MVYQRLTSIFRYRTAVLFASFFLFAAILTPRVFASSPQPITAGDATFGAKDFVAYWSAFEVFRQGGNPYDRQAIFDSQLTIRRTAEEPQLFLNPPWMLVLLSPVLSLGFAASVHIWIVLNICFTLAVALLTRRLMPTSLPNALHASLVGFVFAPVWMTIMLGQMSLFLAAFSLAAVVAYVERKDITAGMCLVLISVKPHPVYLILLALGLCIIVKKRWKVLMSFSGGLSLVIAVTYLISPNSLSQWVGMEFSPLQYRTSSVVTLIRLGVSTISGRVYDWRPVLALPLIASIVLLPIVLRNRRDFDWRRYFFPVAAMSLFTAPYAWLFDYALLLSIQVALLSLMSRKTHGRDYYKIVLSLCCGQVLLLVLQYWKNKPEYFFWFPLYMLVIYWYGSRLLKKELYRFNPVTHRG
jgi:hypothetical protein